MARTKKPDAEAEQLKDDAVAEAAADPKGQVAPPDEPKPDEGVDTIDKALADAEAEADAAGGEETVPQTAPKPRNRRASAKRGQTANSQKAEGAPLSKAKELDQGRRKQNVGRRDSEKERGERLEHNQKFYAGISSLQEAVKTRRIMSGVVAAIETLSANGTALGARRNVTMLSVILEGQYKVMIPFEEFFRDNPIDMSTIDTSTNDGIDILNRRQRQMAEKMYGAVIDFVVTHVQMSSPTDYVIAGSRKQALEVQEARNFIGGRGMQPNFKVGDSVPAHIISVGAYSLRVNVCGVDTSIPLRDVTFRFVTNLATMYQVGDMLTVDIMKVDRRPSDGRIELGVSARGAELKAAKARQEAGLITEGTVTVGQITSIRPSRTKPNTIVIHAYLPYFQMPAVVRAMDPKMLSMQPKAGDQLRLRVTGFSEQGFVLTTCHGYHNAPALFGRG